MLTVDYYIKLHIWSESKKTNIHKFKNDILTKEHEPSHIKLKL
jgi:hypothetical protein